MVLTNKLWVLYILLGLDPTTRQVKRTYIGVSTAFEQRRLRQHRREIAGGAKSLRMWGKDVLIEPCCIVRSNAFHTHLAESFEHMMKGKGAKRRRAVASLETRRLIAEHVSILPLRSLFESLHWDELVAQAPPSITWYLPDHTPSPEVLHMLTPNTDHKITHEFASQPL
jgi:hypothetical protein